VFGSWFFTMGVISEVSCGIVGFVVVVGCGGGVGEWWVGDWVRLYCMVIDGVGVWGSGVGGFCGWVMNFVGGG